MSCSDTKNKVVARIWQSLAQSGVDLSGIPDDQMSALVASIADGVLLAIDESLAAAGLAARQQAGLPATEDEETVLWEGRAFLSLVTWYRITNQRVRIVHGLLGKEHEDIELVRIQDIDHTQHLGERLLNIGDITIRSSDPSRPEVVLYNVRDVEKVHEILRQAMLDARRRYRYSVQEEM